MNRPLISTLVIVATIAACCSTCDAQRRRWYRPGVAAAGYGVYGGWGGGFSSTALEGAQRGMADVIRAEGEANESDARAAIDYEEARSRYMDNKNKWTETYLQRKRMGEVDRKRRHSEIRESRERYLTHKRSQEPARLSTSQLDPATGEIQWPEILMGDDFTKYRVQLDEYFRLRTHTSASADLTGDIHSTARKMQKILKKYVRELSAHDYIAARKFLDRLIREGHAQIS